MKNTWRWIIKLLAIVFTLAGAGFGVYVLISSAGMIGKLDHWGNLMYAPDLPSIIIVAALSLIAGSVFVSIGAFRWKISPVIIGAVAIIFSLVLTFALAVPLQNKWLAM